MPALPLLAGAPAYADPVTIQGLTCGMAASYDPTGGEVYGRGDTAVGPVTGGPLLVTATEPVDSTWIECRVIVTTPDGIVSNSHYKRNTMSGGTVVMMDVVTFYAIPGDRVDVCTQIGWNGWDTRDLGCARAIFFGLHVGICYTVVPSLVTQ